MRAFLTNNFLKGLLFKGEHAVLIKYGAQVCNRYISSFEGIGVGVKTLKEKEKPGQSFLSKHLKKVYPLGIQKNSLSLSLSSLSLSQKSNDSSPRYSIPRVERKIPLLYVLYFEINVQQELDMIPMIPIYWTFNWVWVHQKETETLIDTDQVYVHFHDERWGIPVYDDNQLFELLALSGMLMDYNWTEILKRNELFRQAFTGFDPNIVAKMGKKEITDIGSDKTLMLAESRIVKEFGSFSSYLWGYMNYKPMISINRYPKNVPLRTPKAEAISKDLQRRGFRFVGPVIVYSFMQAAGMAMDHLVDCFRFNECVKLAEIQTMETWLT
ncbi:hypothetical protein HHK36_015088 [Tetracentron sinense]|uniref:DNA-3-methyladenine glycosylase I n=1 Tax=Tetracentron sinense TaxID=13715 RepID=A0A835DDB2_TETSI|nr:hypothetical protein HHK36_015088 [Tetracentron sinense]